MGILVVSAYIVLIIVAILLLFYNFVFLRNPKRVPPEGRFIIAPADGKIVKIISFDGKNDEWESTTIKKGLIGKIKTIFSDTAKEGYAVVITMNIFNVHYQYAPIDGKIEKIEYEKGKFLNAVFGAASLQALENEKNSIIIKGNQLKVKVIQVAGLVARRIVCFVQKNQQVKKAQKLGIIKLGSQVILVMPKLPLKVREGQKTVGGETIIAGY